jgi:N-methylhydantoinase A
MGYRIGIDVGGTFTDLVCLSDNDPVRVVKTPTTPENQAIGVLSGLEDIAALEGKTVNSLLKETDLVIHGTTVATNTMLEFNGASTGLIATKGFRDDIELRRGYKERLFNPAFPQPIPIARRRHRLTVNERINREGNVTQALNEKEVRSVVRKFKQAGVESIGVCLFFSFLNPTHEKGIAKIIQDEYPEAFVSLSSEVLPQIREFERVSTTLVNAYTCPKLNQYLTTLEADLREKGFENEFFVMLSNGGIMSADYAGKYSVYSLLSGPAGGVVSASQLKDEENRPLNLITVDMGGTSYDVSLINRGNPNITTDCWFSRYRVSIPMLEIHTIGAGGGSIAWVDDGGAMHVGPESAGADPGPACYDRGGTQPTVTDANLLLGFIDPDYFLGGAMRLNKDAAKDAVQTKIAGPMGIELMEAAYGIFRIINSSMTNGIREVSVKKGYDPRDFTLVAFGGNGAVHAGMQARDLGIKKVIVPRIATAFSAWGMIGSNIVINKMRTYIANMENYDLAVINQLYKEMRENAEQELSGDKLKESGLIHDIVFNSYIDMHYDGETYEITVPLPISNNMVTPENIMESVNRFHYEHKNLHTFSNPEGLVFIMNLKLEMIVRMKKPNISELTPQGEDSSNALRTKRMVYSEEEKSFKETPVYDGTRIRCGNILEGPCIIEEPATTIVVYQGQRAVLNKKDCYEISVS